MCDKRQCHGHDGASNGPHTRRSAVCAQSQRLSPSETEQQEHNKPGTTLRAKQAQHNSNSTVIATATAQSTSRTADTEEERQMLPCSLCSVLLPCAVLAVLLCVLCAGCCVCCTCAAVCDVPCCCVVAVIVCRVCVFLVWWWCACAEPDAFSTRGRCF
jgi:hypothetical protein